MKAAGLCSAAFVLEKFLIRAKKYKMMYNIKNTVFWRISALKINL